MNLEQIIKEKQATVIDVRSPEEFNTGHVSGSINIPLQDISKRVEELKKLKTPLLLCCASGNRSSMAVQLLSKQGIECYNGGAWSDVNYYKNN